MYPLKRWSHTTFELVIKTVWIPNFMCICNIITRQWLLGTEQLQTLVATDIKEICCDFDSI